MLSICLKICFLCSKQVLLVLIGIIYESSQVYICVKKEKQLEVASSSDLQWRKKKKAYLRNIWGKNVEWNKLNNGYFMKHIHGKKKEKNGRERDKETI